MKSLIVFLVALVALLDPGTVADSQETGMQPGQIFRDCSECPEMVVVPAGSFLMGSSDAETKRVLDAFPFYETAADRRSLLTEHPQHAVTIPRAFGMGKYPVTRGEFAAFIRKAGYVMSGGCTVYENYRNSRRVDAGWERPGFLQTDRDPVVCVSWDDAKAYVAWLNEDLHGQNSSTTAGTYRLPSEAEWEYGARAGTQTVYWWGDSIGSGNSVCESCGSRWDGKQTAPVDGFPRNPFGLSNMLGNAWEWVEDCLHPNYQDAPADGSAWITGSSCGTRVARGGGFFSRPWVLRPADRIFIEADRRFNYIGFRVAKTLP
ncbi:MAG TPA: formylglycine-generating enzyme family protein [Xanthobacteraceae bacterium]|nr:formylglycine-generating enzyme family protein [Xanthobacteraceae bacterium]